MVVDNFIVLLLYHTVLYCYNCIMQLQHELGYDGDKVEMWSMLCLSCLSACDPET